MQRTNSWLTLATLLLFLVAGSIQAVEPASNKISLHVDKCINYADPVRVKIGKIEYHIPDIYKPDLELSYPKHSPLKSCTCRNVKKEGSQLLDIQYGYCQAENAASFEATEIHIGKWNFRKKEHSGSPFKSDWQPINRQYDLLMTQDLIINKGYQPDPIQFFCKKKSTADDVVEKSWHMYKDAEGFYESGGKFHIDQLYGTTLTGQILYYSDKYRLFGMPIIAECDGVEETILYGKKPDGSASKISIGRSCRVRALIGDKGSVYVRFHDKEFLPSEWGAGFKQLEAFLQSIMATHAPDIKFTSCTSFNSKEK